MQVFPYHPPGLRMAQALGYAPTPDAGLFGLSSDAALSHIERVDAAVRALSRDVGEYLKTATRPLAGFETWDAWVAEWQRFYAKSGTPWALFWGASDIDAQTTRYEADLAQWYAKFKAAQADPLGGPSSPGVSTTLPTPVPTPAGSDGPDFSSTLKTATVLAGLATAVYLVHKFS